MKGSGPSSSSFASLSSVAVSLAGAPGPARSAGKSAKAASGPAPPLVALPLNIRHTPPVSQVWPSSRTPAVARSAPSASSPRTYTSSVPWWMLTSVGLPSLPNSCFSISGAGQRGVPHATASPSKLSTLGRPTAVGLPSSWP